MPEFNTDKIGNELGRSAFFSKTPNKTSGEGKEKNRSENRTFERSNGDGNQPNIDRFIQTDKTRVTKRASYELYIDQIELLNKIDTESRRKTGKGINQSDIVRKALDAYLGIK